MDGGATVFGLVKNMIKARLMGRLLTRGMGGGFGSALMAAYLGKKAYDAYQRRKHVRRAY
jgi:hypothetical protein